MLILVAHGFNANAQHTIRLKTNKFIRNVYYVSDNGSWISYQDDQTMHDLMKSKIEYITLDSVYRFYNSDGSYYDKSRYPSRTKSTSTNNYYSPRSKPLSSEQKLQKNFSSAEKFGIGVGQVFIGGGMAVAGTLVGTVVGGIGGLMAEAYSNQTETCLNGCFDRKRCWVFTWCGYWCIIDGQVWLWSWCI
ncbi:MAG: hypothetical protein R2813_10165 [Flavobacteriales bacterium]